LEKHGAHFWFLAAGGAILIAWWGRASNFFVTFGALVASYCLFRGVKAHKDPVGIKNQSMPTATVTATAGPPLGGFSSAVNLPQTMMGTSAKPNWGSGRKNKMFIQNGGGFASTNTRTIQNQQPSSVGQSGLTFPAGVKFMPDQTVVANPTVGSIAQLGTPFGGTPIAQPPNSLGASGKVTGLSMGQSPFAN
jgi:hypothetical protein